MFEKTIGNYSFGFSQHLLSSLLTQCYTLWDNSLTIKGIKGKKRCRAPNEMIKNNILV